LLHNKQVNDFYNTVLQEKQDQVNKDKWDNILRLEVNIPPPPTTNTEDIRHYTEGVTFVNRICDWINENVINNKYLFRTPNLWIWGPTKIGKTTLLQQLANAGCNILYVDYNTSFYDGITSKTQLIVFDEFKAQKTITEMNKICDGSSGRYNIKGASFMKLSPTPVIVCSNFSITEAYNKSDQLHLETLKGRFIEIHAEQHINVSLILKH